MKPSCTLASLSTSSIIGQVHGHALVLHKSLNKRISAEGNTKPLVARCHESLDLSDDALQAATAIVQADPLSHMSALRDSNWLSKTF